MIEALEAHDQLLADTPAPLINNPVDVAKKLMAYNATDNPTPLNKQQAYLKAREQFEREVRANTSHMEAVNKQAYQDVDITDVQPYSADTMTSLILTRSGNGGLEDWKSNSSGKLNSAAASNNPAGIGYDSSTKKYYRYNNFTDGVAAGNTYFNYGAGVKSSGSQGADRMLLPSNINKTDQYNYITTKLKGNK
jgi:hypothetical protein